MTMPDHAKPPARRDHLWVLFIIASSAAIEVCASWVGIGALSGFPVIRLPHLPAANTDFSLMVGMEAYSGYALYRWLACGDGRRARPFAMWSAITALALSLIGQISYHVLAASHAQRHSPYALVGFVAALPVLVVMLAAILVHLVHLDREEDAARAEAAAAAERQAATERAEADERTALRAELKTAHEAHALEVSALREELETAQDARAEAERLRAEADARAARLARKLDAQAPAKSARKTGARTARGAREQEVPGDVDARAEALKILAENPGISGADLGLECGMSKRWGQDRKKEYAGHVPENGTAPENDEESQ